MTYDTQAKAIGLLAATAGYKLPIQVVESRAGFYIGTYKFGPISRESVEYYPTLFMADAALNNGTWTQRDRP